LVVVQRVIIAPEQIQADRIQLSAPQLHYLSRVLRLQSGQQFIAMTGQGQTWRVELAADRANILELLVVKSELVVPVTLAIALPKTGFDDVIRQVTELGVSCIVPIISDRTLLNPSARKQARWQKIIEEAVEQSERAIVPTIIDPITWKQYLASPGQNRFIAWERGDSPSLLTSLNQSVGELEVAIGPEGGWTEGEMSAAIEAGYQAVSLGARILRAVTASVAVMAIVAAQIESR
jgi:16S rRNA (uracil1498-N3)-methyltransferase